jgi:hypothetical protein
MAAWRIYLGLLVLLGLEVAAVAFGWPWRNAWVAGAALGQFALLWFGYLGGAKAQGWVRIFSCLYLLWLAVMLVFMLGELATR